MLRMYSSTAAWRSSGRAVASGAPCAMTQRRAHQRRIACAGSSPCIGHARCPLTHHALADGRVSGGAAQVELRGVAPGEERVGVDRHAVHGELAERAQQLHDAVLARAVARDRDVRPRAQDLADESGQHPARPGLDEDARAGRVHRLDLGREAHRLRDLLGQQRADRVGLGRVRRRPVAFD